MKLFLMFLLFTVVGLICFWLLGRKPHKHRKIPPADFYRFFEALFKRGFNRGFLVIEVPNSPLFVQFSKYILGKGHVGLKLDFPLAPWSEKYYERVKQELSKMNLKFSIVPTIETTVREFITVDLGQDIDKAIALAKMILYSAFELDLNQTFTLYFDNISHKDEKIGF